MHTTTADIIESEYYATIPQSTDDKVLIAVAEFGPIIRSDLVKVTNIPRSTIYDALVRLMLKGLVKNYPEKRRAPGRPKIYYEVV